MTDVFIERLVAAIEPWQLSLNDEQLALMRSHYDAMICVNRRFNITRITDPAEAAVKHYADSLALLPWIRASAPNAQTLLDVGSGAGFPSIPLALSNRALSVIAIDGTHKKADFISTIAQELRLGNLISYHARAEHWQTDSRFDIIVCKAVATLPRYLKWVSRLVSPGGWIVAYKTATLPEQELRDTAETADKLKLTPTDPYYYDLPDGTTNIKRALHIFKARD